MEKCIQHILCILGILLVRINCKAIVFKEIRIPTKKKHDDDHDGGDDDDGLRLRTN
jgi:hypothetical protein